MTDWTESVGAIVGPVAIVRLDRHYRVFAAREFAAGEVIFDMEGEVVATPSRLSVQIDTDRHLEVPAGADLETCLDRYPWRFLNHSCDPNARVVGSQLVALRSLETWHQIAFDYDCTEFRIAAPFSCACGAPLCRREIRGAGSLTGEAFATLLPHMADHLVHLRSAAIFPPNGD